MAILCWAAKNSLRGTHAKKDLYTFNSYKKIKDIKEQMPNKLINLENNKFIDFVCETLG